MMKLSLGPVFLAIFALIVAAGARAEERNFGKAADNKIYAQALVNHIAAANSQLVSTGMHVAKPGTKDYRIIASTLDVIGKKCDPEDLPIAVGGNSVISAPNLKVGKLGILVPLYDRAGNHIGGFATAFKYKPGDDQAAMFTQALALRDQLAKEIPSVGALFEAR